MHGGVSDFVSLVVPRGFNNPQFKTWITDNGIAGIKSAHLWHHHKCLLYSGPHRQTERLREGDINPAANDEAGMLHHWALL
jgi:hypothetical protein